MTSRRSKPASSRKSSASSSVDLGLRQPILGRNFKVPELYAELEEIELDDTLPYVPIYCHFIVPEIEPVIRPKTPPILTALREELADLQPPKPSITARPEQKSRNQMQPNHRQSNKNR